MMTTNKYMVGIDNIKYLIEENLKLKSFFEDSSVTEIQINDDNTIWIEKAGIGKIFTGINVLPEDTLNLIKTLASMEDKEVNFFQPRISTVLPYKLEKYRFEGLIPPIQVNPSCTIRKTSKKIIPLEKYIENGFLTLETANLILSYLKENKNILIVGGTNTGKTTFLNALLNTKIVQKDRLFIIEEVKEIQASSPNKNNVELFPWFDGKEALKSSVRYTPERIIFGEIRGAEAFDMLNVFNTGHGGGICTVHANDCLSALDKLETFMLYTQPHPMSKLIARVINVVVDLSIEGATRYLKSISEVKGYSNGNYILDYKYKAQLDENGKIKILKNNENQIMFHGETSKTSKNEELIFLEEKINNLQSQINILVNILKKS